MKLNLTRPLIFFDLETTGTNISEDRIVEFSYLKVLPGGDTEAKSRRINPERPIPPEATAVHHISDADVADAPAFRQVAKALLAIFDGCDVAGFNSNRFDVPLLMEEFSRCGLDFDIAGRHFIDVQNIFHKMEQRTLVAAYRFYCGKELEGAHSAQADTQATYEVLLSQLDRYPQLKNDVEALAEFSRMGRNLDLAGRIVLNDDNEPTFNFGKNKGRTLREVWQREQGFFDWILSGSFPKNTKDVVLRYKFKFMQEAKKH